MRLRVRGRSNFVKAPDTCMKWSRDFRDDGSPNIFISRSGSLRASFRMDRKRACLGHWDRTCLRECRTGAPIDDEHKHQGEASGMWNFA